jgi:hypothetical protein
MHIVVNHLTKLAPGLICVAGIDQRTGKHVRPLTNRMLRLSFAVGHGDKGVFGIGKVVDLGHVRPVGKAPEVEDHHFREHELNSVTSMTDTDFWQMLSIRAMPRLQLIFGSDLEPVSTASGLTCALPEGHGTASLGCLRPDVVRDLEIERRPTDDGYRETLRVTVMVAGRSFRFPVTDLRMSSLDEANGRWQLHPERIDSVNERLRDGVPALLSVGVSRPFQRSSKESPRHWLQVNNIHLQDDAIWSPV